MFHAQRLSSFLSTWNEKSLITVSAFCKQRGWWKILLLRRCKHLTMLQLSLCGWKGCSAAILYVALPFYSTQGLISFFSLVVKSCLWTSPIIWHMFQPNGASRLSLSKVGAFSLQWLDSFSSLSGIPWSLSFSLKATCPDSSYYIKPSWHMTSPKDATSQQFHCIFLTICVTLHFVFISYACVMHPKPLSHL